MLCLLCVFFPHSLDPLPAVTFCFYICVTVFLFFHKKQSHRYFPCISFCRVGHQSNRPCLHCVFLFSSNLPPDQTSHWVTIGMNQEDHVWQIAHVLSLSTRSVSVWKVALEHTTYIHTVPPRLKACLSWGLLSDIVVFKWLFLLLLLLLYWWVVVFFSFFRFLHKRELKLYLFFF